MKIKKYYNLFIIILFIIAILIRIILFIQNPSLWCDEASLGLNIIDKNYLELLKNLDYLQACPPGFLILTKLIINIFNPQNDYYRDLLFRIIPFTCGIATLFIFYKFINTISKNIYFKTIAFLILAFNPLAINYCTQLKQYSSELMITVILMLIFYKIIFSNEIKNWYSYLIAILPWFSYSSFFIIAPYFAIYYYKNIKKAFIFSLPSIVSLIFYYIFSLRFIFAKNYYDMVSWWTDTTAFLNITQPQRFLLRFGELLIKIPNKYIVALSGFIIIYFIGLFIIKKAKNKDSFLLKIYYLSPLFLTVFASLIHKYPFAQRLILFLLPFFAIFIAYAESKFSKFIQISFVVLILSLSPFYERYYPDINYSYSRDIIQYIYNKHEKDDIILTDGAVEYFIYIKFKQFNIPIIHTPYICNGDTNVQGCKKYIKNEISAGKYYFLTTSYLAKEIIDDVGYKLYKLPIKHKKGKTKAVYFEKI